MDRPRLTRGLRIAWSVWWGILCVLLVVLWMRSYYVPYNLFRSNTAQTTTFGIISNCGRLTIGRFDLGPGENIVPLTSDVNAILAADPQFASLNQELLLEQYKFSTAESRLRTTPRVSHRVRIAVIQRVIA